MGWRDGKRGRKRNNREEKGGKESEIEGRKEEREEGRGKEIRQE